MSEEKIIASEQLDIEELENVVGGYKAFLYYWKQADGNFSCVESPKELTREQVLDFFKNPDKNPKIRAIRGIKASRANEFAERIKNRHGGDVKFVELK